MSKEVTPEDNKPSKNMPGEDMSDHTSTGLSFRHARELLAMIEESSAQEVHIEIAGLTLHVVRGETAAAAQPPASVQGSALPPTTTSATAPPPAVQPAGPQIISSSSEDYVSVLAPTAGVFYRAPSPSEPPFAQPGDQVTAGQIIGIIEVMKLLTHVTAPIDGVLVGFTTDNATPVPFEHPLASINPTAS